MNRKCDFLKCNAEGIYPAPKSRDEINEYIYLCIDHIREFNKSWNYFEGLTDQEFENEVRKSTTWDRPSWKFGTHASKIEFNDHFNIFNKSFNLNKPKKKNKYKIIKVLEHFGLKTY